MLIPNPSFWLVVLFFPSGENHKEGITWQVLRYNKQEWLLSPRRKLGGALWSQLLKWKGINGEKKKPCSLCILSALWNIHRGGGGYVWLVCYSEHVEIRHNSVESVHWTWVSRVLIIVLFTYPYTLGSVLLKNPNVCGMVMVTVKYSDVGTLDLSFSDL